MSPYFPTQMTAAFNERIDYMEEKPTDEAEILLLQFP